MAEPLVITMPHKLGKEEALRRIAPDQAGPWQRFPVLKVEEEVCSDEPMDFRVRALSRGRGRILLEKK